MTSVELILYLLFEVKETCEIFNYIQIFCLKFQYQFPEKEIEENTTLIFH